MTITRSDQQKIRARTAERLSADKVVIKANGEIHARVWSGIERRYRWLFAGWDTDVLDEIRDHEKWLASKAEAEAIEDEFFRIHGLEG